MTDPIIIAGLIACFVALALMAVAVNRERKRRKFDVPPPF